MRHLLITVLCILSFSIPTIEAQNLLSENTVIPKPFEVVNRDGFFSLNSSAQIKFEDVRLRPLAHYLQDLLSPATGFDLSLRDINYVKDNPVIALAYSDEMTEEGYQIDIRKTETRIVASTNKGIFYGIQTLRHLLHESIELNDIQDQEYNIACGVIKDQPDYSYRGAMLDVARHFFKKEDVMRYVDLLALYKINTLHLHLTDDQGWRIEIKSWPNLTAHGGSTAVGGGDGGFYTQEDYRDIIQYAEKRFITIIPEIDMPGHTNSALSSYAVLNCDHKTTELYTKMRVGFSTLCTTSDSTYIFIDDVIRELAEMTPGPYIHIGGDESDATPIDEYITFIDKAQTIVNNHGKKVLGWDEIAHSKLYPNTIVQFWRKEKNALMGIEKGAKVLMSPANNAYLDMKYDANTKIGLRWAGYTDIDEAYNWSLEDFADGIDKEDIIGIEAPLWAETIVTIEDLEFLAFPRIIGIAEIGWTPTRLRQWDDYKLRLAVQGKRLTNLGVNFYHSPLVDW